MILRVRATGLSMVLVFGLDPLTLGSAGVTSVQRRAQVTLVKRPNKEHKFILHIREKNGYSPGVSATTSMADPWTVLGTGSEGAEGSVAMVWTSCPKLRPVKGRAILDEDAGAGAMWPLIATWTGGTICVFSC